MCLVYLLQFRQFSQSRFSLQLQMTETTSLLSGRLFWSISECVCCVSPSQKIPIQGFSSQNCKKKTTIKAPGASNAFFSFFLKVFVCLVIALTGSVVLIVYLCVLPLIIHTYPTHWIFWHLCYGHWNLVNIVFHYYKAVTTSPGHSPQVLHPLLLNLTPPLHYYSRTKSVWHIQSLSFRFLSFLFAAQFVALI